MTTILLLHPGEMGAAVGAVLTGAGHEVLWDPTGRSADTTRRAEAAGLARCDGLVDGLRRCDVVVSICPPHAARAVAGAVAATNLLGDRPYLDANAVSPATASRIAELVAPGYVDGGIIGGPPAPGTGTRLYLSGPGAAEVAELWPPSGSGLDVLVMTEGGPVAASALKMAYAGWTKGSAALLLAVRAAAEAHGVGAALDAEWARSQPDLARRSAAAAASAGEKGWRWAGEMEEIAATLEAAGQPPGFHAAAADVYRGPLSEK